MSISVSPYNPLQQGGVRSKTPPDLIIVNRAPISGTSGVDFGFPPGQIWLYPNIAVYILGGFSNVTTPNWFLLGTSGGDLQVIGVQASSAPGTNPVTPTVLGQINFTSSQVASGFTVGATPVNGILIASTVLNQVSVLMQISAAAASSDPTLNGLCHFDSSVFSVDADGFVTISSLPLTIGAFGSTPNADGLTLTGTVLNMEPADATHPGGVSILSQTMAGAKTFSSGILTNTINKVGSAVTAIDVQNYQMNDNSGNTSIDWHNRTLKNATQTNVDWGNRILYDSSNVNQLSWSGPGVVIPISATSPVFAVLSGGGGTSTIQYPASAANYNFNLPSTAGTSGQLLTSAAGGSNAMTWTTVSSIAVTTAQGTSPITVNGLSGTPASGAITIATGIIPLNLGGTNANLTASLGGVFYSTATAGAILSGTATATQMLQSGASAAPAWSTTTWPATSTINRLLYSSATNTISEITASNNGVLISSATGVPSWLAAGSTGQVLIATTSNPASWGTLSSIAVTSITATAPLTANGTSATPQTGAVTVALTTPLALSFGGTNANLTASNGGIFYSTSTAGAILSGTATARQMLQSGSSTTPAWSTTTWPATSTINRILYSSATSVIGEITSANNGVLITSATGVPSMLAAGTTGQVLIATTSNPASWGSVPFTLTGDTGTATASSGSIQIRGNSSTSSGKTVVFTGSGAILTLSTTDANSSTAIGVGAGASLTGSDCTFLGKNAGNAHTSNNQSTFIGSSSGVLSTGPNNAALGYLSLSSNTSSQGQTAIGWRSLQNATGGFNTAIGLQSGQTISTGQFNTSIGGASMTGGTLTGNYNIALGYTAGNAWTTSEDSNIAIGNPGTAADSHVIRIGTQGSGDNQQNKCFIHGIVGVSIVGNAVLINASGQLGDTVSSRRFKENIEDVGARSILDLRPVRFNYVSDEAKTPWYGFIAEEVEEVFPELVFYKEDQPYSVMYHLMAPLLLNEIKKLKQQIETMRRNDAI